jgi:molybdopterin/thiamine biosynthesis adenylyltransferase
MSKQELIAKKALYEAKKVELSLETHEEEIKEIVDKFRIQKEQEIIDFENEQRQLFANQKAADETKVNNYLELLDELIADATKKELLEKEAAETDCQIENTVSDN